MPKILQRVGIIINTITSVMKKFVFAVATALVMGLTLTSCSKNKVDAALDEYEEIVNKVVDAKKSGDEAKALECLGDIAKWAEKYKDLEKEGLTKAQEERLKKLSDKMDF